MKWLGFDVAASLKNLMRFPSAPATSALVIYRERLAPLSRSMEVAKRRSSPVNNSNAI